jgi:flotillin
MTLKPSIKSVETAEGVAVSCNGVAQVCIMKDPTMLALAAEQFVGKPPNEIQDIILQTIEGHFRSILGTMTVEEIFSDREGFAKQVREIADPDVAKMGIRIISFVIQDIKDEVDYLFSLGVKQAADVKRNADIGVANAKRDAGIKTAEAQREHLETKYKCDALIAENKRSYELKQAEYDQEVNARKAEAELAYQLQGAQEQQKIKEENMQIEVVERRKQIDIEEQEVMRKEKELYCSKRAPAEAEAQKVSILANAQRTKTLAYAGAEAQAIKAVGTAEAYQIEVIGKAEAEQMRQKAAAYSQYGDAAVMSLILESLPKIAAEVASPMSKIDEIVITSGGDGSMSSEVTKLLAQLPPSVQALTGLDLTQALAAAMPK